MTFSIKGGRHYTASQLLAAGFDRRNTAARLGRSSGGATTRKYYADPEPEVDRRAAGRIARCGGFWVHLTPCLTDHQRQHHDKDDGMATIGLGNFGSAAHEERAVTISTYLDNGEALRIARARRYFGAHLLLA